MLHNSEGREESKGGRGTWHGTGCPGKGARAGWASVRSETAGERRNLPAFHRPEQGPRALIIPRRRGGEMHRIASNKGPATETRIVVEKVGFDQKKKRDERWGLWSRQNLLVGATRAGTRRS